MKAMVLDKHSPIEERPLKLADLPKGAQLEYRVIAINLVPENPLSWFCSRGKSGEGQPSNTVMVVL
ncbi:MAG: hypothetical protein MUO27_09255 [Sedimentisphaerales bacterium]|nr:hypothetical protein [Sedimentisphaerales bacterium]